MLLIKNISLTRRAEPDFLIKRLAFKARPGEVFALVWVFSFLKPDGTTAPGFEPGYMCGPLYSHSLVSPWAIAQLRDGTMFHFMPRFDWDPDEQYVVDKQGFMFWIGPARQRFADANTDQQRF